MPPFLRLGRVNLPGCCGNRHHQMVPSFAKKREQADAKRHKRKLLSRLAATRRRLSPSCSAYTRPTHRERLRKRSSWQTLGAHDTYTDCAPTCATCRKASPASQVQQPTHSRHRRGCHPKDVLATAEDVLATAEYQVDSSREKLVHHALVTSTSPGLSPYPADQLHLSQCVREWSSGRNAQITPSLSTPPPPPPS